MLLLCPQQSTGAQTMDFHSPDGPVHGLLSFSFFHIVSSDSMDHGLKAGQSPDNLWKGIISECRPNPGIVLVANSFLSFVLLCSSQKGPGIYWWCKSWNKRKPFRAICLLFLSLLEQDVFQKQGSIQIRSSLGYESHSEIFWRTLKYSIRQVWVDERVHPGQLFWALNSLVRDIKIIHEPWYYQ